MGLVERFKRDILKHRGRSAVLGVLTIVMTVMSIKAFFDMKPAGVNAAGPATAEANGTHLPLATAAEAEEQLNQSRALWRTLREVKPGSVSASVAFAFDASYYPAPAGAPAPIVDAPSHIDPEPMKLAPVVPVVDAEAIKAERIREQSKQLIVSTIAVGTGANSEPMAIINGKLLTVQQDILGFVITAIRPREVELIKEGVTVVRPMPGGQ